MVMINPGGAERLSGADGIRIQLNSGPNYKAFPLTSWAVYEGGDQVYFSRRQFWNTSTAGPSLQIGGAQANGGVLVGNAGPAAGFPSLNASDWTSVTVVETSGAVDLAPSGDATTYVAPPVTGSGSAAIKYEYTDSGKTWTVLRRVSYTFPNQYFTDRYDVTVPAGSPNVVLYTGGDAAPGDYDNSYVFGTGAEFAGTTPTAVYASDPGSQMYLSYQQVAGEPNFSGLVAKAWPGASDPTVVAMGDGGDIGFSAANARVDGSMWAQWTIGSAAGTVSRTMHTRVGYRGVESSVSLGASTAVAGASVPLTISLSNTDDKTNAYGFTMALPSGMTVAGAATTGCAGAVTAAPGSSSMSLAGGSLARYSVCTVSVPVTSAATGTYTVKDQAVEPSGALIAGYGASTITFTAAPATAVPAAPAEAAKTTVTAPRVLATAVGPKAAITRVAVPGPGRVVVTASRGKGFRVQAFAPSAKAMSKEGIATIRSALTPATRAALRKGPVRVRITATYTAPDGRTSRTTRVVTLKRLAPLPVTG